MFQLRICIITLLIVSRNCIDADQISCVDRSGSSVSWSLTYKLPKIKSSPNPKYRVGSGHVINTPELSQWVMAEEGIDDPESMIGKTLTPLFQNLSSSFAYFLYNDQPPNGSTIFNNGHTKGVILTNTNGGIWLIHSVPHFPPLDDSHRYSYPRTGFTNGQMFLCLTLNVSQIDGIAEVLTYTRPNIFNYHLPKAMVTLLPNLSRLVKTQVVALKRPPWFKLLELKIENLNFLIFAKGPKFYREIYADWIAPTLVSPLNVQSWRNGIHPLASNCTSPNLAVHNILFKKLDGQEFSSHSDHSKWAVGENASWACIGDLNRMEHQKRRGGAVLCTDHGSFRNLLSASITDIQPCPRKTRGN